MDTMTPASSHTTPMPIARVIVDPDILGGQDVVAGSRVPALTIVAYLREGCGVEEIRRDYPALSADGVRAIELWAAAKFGPDWMSLPSSA